MEPSAKVIADSISPDGIRLTTLEVVMHRFVLAEFNTHRVFSRNSASSRAIPVDKQLRRVQEDPAWPVLWAAEQPGMQGGAELTGDDLVDASELFAAIHEFTVGEINLYLDKHPEKSTRLHKSLLNRLLEPFMWHTAIVTSTEWDGFWHQRCSPLAQPEIHATADAMFKEYHASEPRFLEVGDWHTPYLVDDEIDGFLAQGFDPRHISVARCTRVSRENHGDLGKTPAEDVALYEKLISEDPAHASPLEHVATPLPPYKNPQPRGMSYVRSEQVGNFTGWRQLRHEVLGF